MAEPDDDWFDDDEPAWGAQEEPHCPPCGDSGYVGRRHCEACNPTRLQHTWWLLTWRVHRAVRWVGDRLRGRQYDSEAPF
ncbi:hypothetical protein ABZ847_29310 [Streptomyces bauhiniae]